MIEFFKKILCLMGLHQMVDVEEDFISKNGPTKAIFISKCSHCSHQSDDLRKTNHTL